MKDKSKLTAIILVIITIVVVIVSLIFDNKEKNDIVSDINIVSNYSNFYTVNSCLYRTISYISSTDSESLFMVLDDNYKKDNNITQENVLTLFNNVEENYTFVSKKMYYQTINDNITKYYVYGQAQLNQIYDDNITNKVPHTDMYFIVYMDNSNKTFSIEPYTSELFLKLGGDNNEK